MPQVSDFALRAWTFEQHMSGGNATQPGLFSLFYSIPSNYWTAVKEQKKPPVFFQLLSDHGYDTAIYWASELSKPTFHKTIYYGLAHLPLNGAPGDNVGDRDRYITQQAIKYLSSRESKNPFFLQLFYNAPHGFCAEQSFSAPHQPALAYCNRITLSNEDDPRPYFNRYLNAVTFTDAEIGKVLSAIKRHGYLDNSIVVITSDHGQEFNDNHQNYWGHSGNFTKAQVQIPLVIYWPGEAARRISYLTTSYDVIPTLLQRLFDCKNPISDYSIGQNLFVNKGRLPFLLAGSYVNMGVIEPDRISVLEVSGRIYITDPAAKPMDQAKPRVAHIQHALQLMRKYFKPES